MPSRAMKPTSHDGFSLPEMIIVAAIVMIGSAVAIPVTMQMVNNSRGDSAAVMTATILQSARNRAVAERRNMVLNFVSDRSLQVQRVNVPDGSLTVVDTLQLEDSQRFVRAGLIDTPDAFGGTGAINFTGTAPVMFTSDGSLIDSAGDVTNGTVFVVRPDKMETARAVTIFGVTGVMRTWKWRGSQWMQ